MGIMSASWCPSGITQIQIQHRTTTVTNWDDAQLRQFYKPSTV